MTEHVDVFVTVTQPNGDKSISSAGSFPAWALPIPSAWKKARKAAALEEMGHYPQPNDGWRVTFSYERA